MFSRRPKLRPVKSAWFAAAFATSMAAVLFCGTLARAADIAVKAPNYSAPAPVLSWSGFYVGGSVGGVMEHVSGTSDFLDTGAFGQYSSPNPQNNSFSNTRFIGGLQAGYNWQIDPRWVVGVEADWSWTHAGYSFCRQTDSISTACLDATPNLWGFESVSGTTRWIATARARAGVTLANVLLYGTGGVAWGRVETTLSQSCMAFGCGSSQVLLAASSVVDTTKVGWTAGLGAEAMLSANWSVKGEWLHIDLGNNNSSFSTAGFRFSGGGVGPSVQTTSWSRSEAYDVLRIGLNYKFAGTGLQR
jgi:outer membrane immunogenic protein